MASFLWKTPAIFTFLGIFCEWLHSERRFPNNLTRTVNLMFVLQVGWVTDHVTSSITQTQRHFSSSSLLDSDHFFRKHRSFSAAER